MNTKLIPYMDTVFFRTCRRGATRATLLPMLLIICALCASCSSSGRENAADSTPRNADYQHADNDIAMTIRSIMDAMRVDQPLDSSEYNFRGILTNGSGMPLYTDIQGAPGQWEVEVITPTKARVKNLYLGDLVPEELTQYILMSLQIPDSLVVTEGSPVNMPDAEMAIYDFGPGRIIFETLTAKTESGSSGPLINILLMKKHKQQIPA